MTLKDDHKPVLLHKTVAVITALFGTGYLLDGWDGPWWVFLSYSLFACISVVLRLGWVIPFAILGVVAGFLANPIAGSHPSLISHAEITIALMLIGIVVGFAFDLLTDDERESESPGDGGFITDSPDDSD